MLSTSDRQLILKFLEQHADGDVLIQAANRVANNLDDVETLKKFMAAGRSVVPVSRDNAVPSAPVAEMKAIDSPEDLGPAASKLGVNGQEIQKHMEKHRDSDWTVDGLCHALKLSAAKVKPMLGLLLEREIVVRVSNNTYQAK